MSNTAKQNCTNLKALCFTLFGKHKNVYVFLTILTTINSFIICVIKYLPSQASPSKLFTRVCEY